jgi:hypothetical protein
LSWKSDNEIVAIHLGREDDPDGAPTRAQPLEPGPKEKTKTTMMIAKKT